MVLPEVTRKVLSRGDARAHGAGDDAGVGGVEGSRLMTRWETVLPHVNLEIDIVVISVDRFPDADHRVLPYFRLSGVRGCGEFMSSPPDHTVS